MQARDLDYPVRGDEAASGDWRDHPGQPRCRAAQLVEESINHMLQHLDKPLRVSTLSSLAGFSSSHYTVLFKSATGLAPKEFFILLRMQHARKMLMTCTVSVKEVAGALGYDDEFYFSRLFKSVVGLAPRDYRQKMSRSRQSPMPFRWSKVWAQTGTPLREPPAASRLRSNPQPRVCSIAN